MLQIAVFQECVRLPKHHFGYILYQASEVRFNNEITICSKLWTTRMDDFSPDRAFSQGISIQSIDLDECISQSLWRRQISHVGEQKHLKLWVFVLLKVCIFVATCLEGISDRYSKTLPHEFVTNQAGTFHFMASPPYKDETPPHWPHCILTCCSRIVTAKRNA